MACVRSGRFLKDGIRGTSFSLSIRLFMLCCSPAWSCPHSSLRSTEKLEFAAEDQQAGLALLWRWLEWLHFGVFVITSIGVRSTRFRPAFTKVPILSAFQPIPTGGIRFGGLEWRKQRIFMHWRLWIRLAPRSIPPVTCESAINRQRLP